MLLGAFDCAVEFGREHGEAFVVAGYGIHTGIELTEEQCYAFSEAYAVELTEAQAEHWLCAAEDAADAAMDR